MRFNHWKLTELIEYLQSMEASPDFDWHCVTRCFGEIHIYNGEEKQRKHKEPKEGFDIYKIQTGDSLPEIAERFYGDEKYVGKIIEDNNITNPRIIFPGDSLYIRKDG